MAVAWASCTWNILISDFGLWIARKESGHYTRFFRWRIYCWEL